MKSSSAILCGLVFLLSFCPTELILSQNISWQGTDGPNNGNAKVLSSLVDGLDNNGREGFLLCLGIGSGLISTNSYHQTASETKLPLCFNFRIGGISSGGLAMYWSTVGSYYTYDRYGGVLTEHGFGMTYFLMKQVPSLYFSGGVGGALWILEGYDGLEGALGYDLSGGIGYEFSPHWSVDGTMSFSSDLTSNYSRITSTLARLTLNYLAY